MFDAAYVRAAFVIAMVIIVMLTLSKTMRQQALSPNAATMGVRNEPPIVANPIAIGPDVVAGDSHPSDDGVSFRERWQERITPPPVRYVPEGASVEDVARAAVPAAAQLPKPPRHRPRAKAKQQAARKGGDVCARHGRRKVEYTKRGGWKYWRCRR